VYGVVAGLDLERVEVARSTAARVAVGASSRRRRSVRTQSAATASPTSPLVALSIVGTTTVTVYAVVASPVSAVTVPSKAVVVTTPLPSRVVSESWLSNAAATSAGRLLLIGRVFDWRGINAA
jgi:hypothetical protein